MTDGWLGGEFARETNDRFSTVYDDFNHDYLNVQWTGRLLERAEAAGLPTGRRLLDLGCGTGLSAIPMLDRGWTVLGCDVSPAMVEIARSKTGKNDRAKFVVADMRDLPDLGEFDLVWAVNDAVNYLLGADELQSALEGMRRSLAQEGAVLFDLNTLESYRTYFADELKIEHDGRTMTWSGRVESSRVEAGMIAEARFEREGDPESIHVHRQRHFPESVVRGALQAAGLQLVAVYGELEGELDGSLDEDLHSKAVYVCRAGQRGGGH
jgi:SAM-dependent methyltransferase